MKEKFVRINAIEGYEEIRDCYWISNTDEDIIVMTIPNSILCIV